MVAMQRTVSKSHLKANMLKIFRELEVNNEELIVTDNNTPVLLITPIKKTESVDALFGDLRGQVIYHEAIDIPSLEEWETA
jgi:antitoxin (DNA-binding transcriptional repressor) of toxin-antitoxin stability system